MEKSKMGIRSMYVLISFTVVFTLTCFSQSKPNESSPTCATVASEQTSPSEFDQRYPRYQLHPGDSFDVVFEYVPDFNQSVTVQPDGFVMLREVGDVHVAGRAIQDLQQKLCSAYGKILYSPSVAIN